MLGSSGSVAADVVLVGEGEARAAVVVRADAPDPGPEWTAARELIHFVEQMSGVQLPIVTSERSTTGARIVLKLKPDAPHPHYDGYWLHIQDADVIIQATEPRGCLYGVYGLLRELGCRWYDSTQIATIIPTRRTLSVPDDLDVRREPDFKHRYPIAGTPAQTARMGYNFNSNPWKGGGEQLAEAEARDLRQWGWGHLWPKLVTQQYRADGEHTAMDFAGHEDWLPMDEAGQRVANGHTLCFSNPEALAWFAENVTNYVVADGKDLVSIWAADKFDNPFCRCEQCQSRNWNPGDWNILVTNEARKRLDERGWEGRLGWIAYFDTREAPIEVALYNHGEKMDFLYAPCGRHGGHFGPFTSDSWANVVYRDRLNGWLEYLDAQDYRGTKTVFEYYFDMINSMFVPRGRQAVGRTLLSPSPEVMQADIHFYREKGFDGFFDCCPPVMLWPDPLGKWLFGELLWDTDLDLEAAKTDFYAHYCGPAAEVMRGARESLMRSMEAGLAQDHVEEAHALASTFAEALRLAGDDQTIQTRIKAAQLHAEFAALCLESEVAESALQDKDKAVAIEHSIVEFLQQHADFLVSNGFGDPGYIRGFSVQKRLQQIGVAD